MKERDKLRGWAKTVYFVSKKDIWIVKEVRETSGDCRRAARVIRLH